MSKSKFYPIDPEKYGVGGLLKSPLKEQEQDATATSWEGYAVVFFPKITGLGAASVNFFGLRETLSATPEAAIVRFMDKIHPTQTWSQYVAAGHKVRRVQVTDLGDARDDSMANASNAALK